MLGLGRPVVLVGPSRLRRPGGNLLFVLFVSAVLAFTLLAATHRSADPLLLTVSPSSSSAAAASLPLTSFLTSTSNSTFLPDPSLLRTGEDFPSASPSPLPDPTGPPSLDPSDDVDAAISTTNPSSSSCDPSSPVDCAGDRHLFRLLMRHSIDAFPDLNFFRFSRPVPAPSPSPSPACDMAWRFRPKSDSRPTLYKDYRRFHLARAADCSLSVARVGGFHSGLNARRRSRRRRPRPPRRGKKEKKSKAPPAAAEAEAVVVVGEAVNDGLPVVASESEFGRGRYLIYTGGGGERCKSMNHFLWGFLCALGEARYLNRTLVMDLRICDAKDKETETEKKDFRFYFDFEHLKDSASVIDQAQFWTDWGKWHEKDKLGLFYVDDFRVTPMKLAGVTDALIMRKFGDAEPDSYWYRVCEGETEAVIQRPWELIWKSRQLTEIVSAVAARMNWDFDSVHVVRGEKAKNAESWPNLGRDTSPDALLAALADKVDEGRNLYIATNEPDTSFFDPLKDRYNVHFLDDFKDLWGENSEWYAETKELNNGVPVEFDRYMRVEVDTEVFLRGKKQIETFNDLTKDCKDGINTCSSSSS